MTWSRPYDRSPSIDTRGAKRVAVLIDADNLGPQVLDTVMAEAKRYGTVVVACAYKNWTDNERKAWGAGLCKHGIHEVEQAPGHNATDIALAMDALDLLYSRVLDVVCVVSKDRDFEPLAARLRRGRVMAVWMSATRDVKPFQRNLWDDFVDLNDQSQQASAMAKAKTGSNAKKPGVAAPTAPPLDLQPLIAAVRARLAANEVKKDSDGWARLSEVYKEVPQTLRKPALKKALKHTKAFEICPRAFGGKGGKVDGVRERPTRTRGA